MELEFREAQLPNIVATCKASRRFLEGATVIASVRKRQLAEVAEFGVSHAVAIDDDAAIASLEAVDGVADTVAARRPPSSLAGSGTAADSVMHPCSPPTWRRRIRLLK